jgi:hypothetical protein
MNITKLTSSTAPLIGIHGMPGLGKTTLASKFRTPLLFAYEKGLPSGVSMDAVEGVEVFEQTMAALGEIWKNGPADHGTLVFDSLSRLEFAVHAAVCREHRLESIESASYGKGYTFATERWNTFGRALTKIRDKHNVPIVLICHSAIERVDDPRAPSFTSYQFDLHKRARSLIMGLCDAVLFLSEDLRTVTDGAGFNERVRGASDGKRYLFTEGKPSYAAKNRYGLPPKIPCGLDFDITTLTKYWQKEESE